MVGDAIAKPADGVEPTMDQPSGFPATCQESFVDSEAPDRTVVTWTEQAHPKRKLELSDKVIDLRAWMSPFRLVQDIHGVRAQE